MRNIEAYLDIDKLVVQVVLCRRTYLQVLEIPANHLIKNAGADVRAPYFKLHLTWILQQVTILSMVLILHLQASAHSNGQTNSCRAAINYTQFITATDTIDCTIAGAAPATGRLRVYATVIDLSGHGLDDAPADVDRDQLA